MNKAIFWDLQGTLGGTATGNIHEFSFYPFSFDALKLAEEKGFMNIVITNQSKIGRGIISAEEYNKITGKLKSILQENGVKMDDWLVCPHTNEDKCNCKKPKTGLIDYCIEKHNLVISECYVIGDMGKNEIIMADNAGCKGILVLTGGGQGSINEFRNTWKGYEAHIIAENALNAVKLI